jgi:G6PDH family F420-dependent oxidoreductase
MLVEAVEIIGALLDGGYVNYRGEHFQVDSAKVWDLPPHRPRIGLAVSGRNSLDLAVSHADAMITVEPAAELVGEFTRRTGRPHARTVGQLPICYDPDRDAAVRRAHDQFRWFAGGWKVNAELPGTAGFAGATQFVRPEDVAGSIPCGPDLDTHLAAIAPYVQAGFSHVAVVQIGGAQQEEFLDWSENTLLPAVRERFGKAS